ncbi:hypothetical protein AgCh_033954 [Apium graveolens]
MLHTPTSAEFKSVKNTIIDVVESQHSMAYRLYSLEDKVSSIGDKLDALFSLLSNTDAKNGEKIVATKCAPNSIQTKDKDIDGDGDKNKNPGDKNDKNPVTDVQIASTAQQPQHSKKTGSSGQRKSTGAHKAKHKTTDGAPEDDEVTISNLADAKGLFFPYRHKEIGEEIVLYYKDKRFEQKNARSALGYITEEFPDLTPEEAVMPQKELMAQIEAEANTSKGREKRGGRSTRARGRGARGRTSKLSQVTAFNSTFLNFLSREGYVPVQGHEEDEEVQKPEELIIQRKKRSATDIDQANTANQNVTPDANTNPEVKADPDAINLITDFDSDEKVIEALNKSALTRVVTSHISEVDEKENVDGRKADQACKYYIKNDRISRLRDSISEQEDIDKSIKKTSWVEYNKKLKLVKSRTRGGIDHSNMEILRTDLLNTNTLIENIGEIISPSHLEKVKAVKIVYRKINDNDVREEILKDSDLSSKVDSLDTRLKALDSSITKIQLHQAQKTLLLQKLVVAQTSNPAQLDANKKGEKDVLVLVSEGETNVIIPVSKGESAGSITTWEDLAQKFLVKFYPMAKTGAMRSALTQFAQQPIESICEAWEGYMEMLRKCSHHGMPDWMVITGFYNGLGAQSGPMLDAASRGALWA